MNDSGWTMKATLLTTHEPEQRVLDDLEAASDYKRGVVALE